MMRVVWFKRDLRLADHPALALACAPDDGPVIPLYILEPDLWAQPDASARHFGFVLDCLRALDGALRVRGSALVVRVGRATDVLSGLQRATGFAQMISHEETGNGWSFERDKQVAAWARANGVQWQEVPQCGVVRRLPDRDGWARQRDRFVFDTCLPEPAALPRVDLASDPIPTAEALGLTEDAPQRQRGGIDQAQALLTSFLTARGQSYRKDMSSPLTGAVACSRLSPHLAFGSLSVRQTALATADRQRQVRGTRMGWGGSLKSFQSRLAWRDHFVQKLEDEPQIEWRNMHRAYDGLRPKQPDATRLQAWCAGETGLPFVDACMRSLAATGWLNFRMRSMVMAVASYHLWLDWPATGRHLARMFTDYEPGIHWSQVQMQSGTTGINTPRIYNPIKQGLDQDPTGVFTRTWVPELRDVPDVHLQTPWVWSGAGQVLGRTYPDPIVDPVAAAKTAREAVWAVRGQKGFRDTAQGVIRKHASRKDSAGRFVNDRAPRAGPKRKAKATDGRQMTLDL